MSRVQVPLLTLDDQGPTCENRSGLLHTRGSGNPAGTRGAGYRPHPRRDDGEPPTARPGPGRPHTPPAGAGRAGASSRPPPPRLLARRPAGPYAFPHEPPSTGHAPHRSCRALPRRGRTSPAPLEQPCSRPLAAKPGVRRPGPGAWSDQSPVPAAGGAGRRCQAAPGKLPGFSGPPSARPPAGVFRGSPGVRSRGCGSGPPPRRRCG